MNKQLTPREKQVIDLVSIGLNSAEIAKLLSVAVRTVDAHRSNIIQKYGAANLAHAVRMAIERGDLPISVRNMSTIIEI